MYRSLNQRPSEVAPFMGAWIETTKDKHTSGQKQVAPFMGAWIETHKDLLSYRLPVSLPSWERGLKHGTYIHLLESGCRSLHGSVD